jgi:ribosomal protein L37AE/L43A
MAVDERPTHGCMTCHAQQPYTVERFANGNTGWRCVVCGHLLTLIPGTYMGSSEGWTQAQDTPA